MRLRNGNGKRPLTPLIPLSRRERGKANSNARGVQQVSGQQLRPGTLEAEFVGGLVEADGREKDAKP